MTEDNETIEDILAELRERGECRERSPVVYDYANRIEAAHKRELETKDSVIQTLSAARDDELDRHRREVDALKQRCAELGAEVAAKDVVIKRMNDAIAEEQRRKMETTEKSSAVGAVAKLREALEDIGRIVEQIRLLYSDYPYEIHVIARKARTALAAPVKNCEVGTAKEQSERFNTYCFNHRTRERCCEDCPIKDAPCCELAWAQMPCESEAEK